jgi:hypothetical protein
MREHERGHDHAFRKIDDFEIGRQVHRRPDVGRPRVHRDHAVADDHDDVGLGLAGGLEHLLHAEADRCGLRVLCGRDADRQRGEKEEEDPTHVQFFPSPRPSTSTIRRSVRRS